jgi:predicted nucleic acid-binding protein
VRACLFLSMPSALFYARPSAELTAKGTAIGPHDLIIAATALAKGYIESPLATNAAFREFRN